MQELYMDNYIDLAHAIVMQAVKDYRSALRVLGRKPNDGPAIYRRMALEKFFRSEWFEQLAGIDPERLIVDLEGTNDSQRIS